jgi:hypothetical protein
LKDNLSVVCTTAGGIILFFILLYFMFCIHVLLGLAGIGAFLIIFGANINNDA